ncbi:hypothetical protein TWF696_007736 [Orbilia brochopaga]|uniref:Glycogen debranching enzyme n=1 Tax=Orbilia brochopaga TaxID=3140254 RepID=A0AAV9ULT0_9PEZI
MAKGKVYLLKLDDSGTPDVNGTYVRLPPPIDPYTLRISIEGTSSITREGSLWINVPEKGETFYRDKFREHKLTPDFTKNLAVDVPIYTAGVYAFYTTYSRLPDWDPLGGDATAEEVAPTRTPTFYVCVSPHLTINGKTLELDALALISAISKWMGPLSNWEPQLARVSDRGYNMVHFTPMMWRGESHSPYSIYSQLDFDPSIFPKGKEGIDTVTGIVNMMEQKYRILSLTDVVWNHTANNSSWLQDHPEAGYNCKTAPWLESAYELDTALVTFGKNLSRLGFPTELKGVSDLLQIMEGIKTHAIGATRLWEYYVIDTERDAHAGVLAWGNKQWKELDIDAKWTFQERAVHLAEKGLLGTDRLGERFRRQIDPEVSAGFIRALFGEPSSDHHEFERQEVKMQKELLKYLDEVNLPLYKEYDVDAGEALEQIFNRVKYVRLDDHGPKQGPITPEFPLIESYFTRLPVNRRTSKFDKSELALANNGWMWGADPMVDFAGPTSRAYLRREVIVWGDCVKLRFGKGPDDSPWLWDHMRKYTELMASIFHGFRIDNCHSTPIHVAEYLLDAARRVRPNLYIAAELFSGSEAKDYIFLQRLGINSLIREAMQAWGPAELSKLVHRHAGKPIGSFEQDHVKSDGSGDLEIRKITASSIHALFADCTHDNDTPTQRRVPEDTLPNGALVSMCSCATGSVMGYDDINPKLLDVVNESRVYDNDDASLRAGGIGWVKKILNDIHSEMGNGGYNEMHVHHEGEYITVHRLHPQTHEGYFLIAHTAFSGGTHRGDFNPVYLTSTKVETILSAKLTVNSSQHTREKILKDPKFIKGLPSKVVKLANPGIREEGNNTIVTVPDDFPPGSIILMKTWIPSLSNIDLDALAVTDAAKAFQTTTLTDLNFALYRCDAEERDHSDGKIGVYNVPDFGPLVYAGLQGWWSVLRTVIRNNDLGHPICQHLRSGTWALDYTVSRLEALIDQGFTGLRGPASWLKERFEKIKQIPNFLVPRYFAMVIQTAYDAATDRAIELFGDNVKHGHDFVKALALVSVQVTGYMKSASLRPDRQTPCMAAGLPHFSNTYMRCWGRDIFISLRGLFIGTGRYNDAKEHILAFAAVVKHGMIPNLLASGTNPRYNSRDSVWFFLQNIQDFTKFAPNGISILDEKVKRRFLPWDDTWFPLDDPRAFSKESTLGEVVFECLQRHATGMSFREANAGPNLDSQMKHEGFQIEIHPDWNTGIIFGGNQWNCGTWMDKMGESERAGSKGVPGTPRDGAPIEMTGLLYSALRWVDGLHKSGKFNWKGVNANNQFISWENWAEKIKANFEKCYYIPKDPGDDSWYHINPSIINRRGIYKDLYKSGKEYEDYQLRPNFPIAMAVAPDLFDPTHALGALKIADDSIRGPYGMSTLDPIDLNYRPFYINWDDSTDFSTSKGRNYHQGPEWLWPTGFFLRAFLHFDLLRKNTPEERIETFQQIHRRIQKCKEMINESPWAGLTELTQKNGEFCSDSCPTQAWSASCMIDLFQDASQVATGQS